MPSADVGRESDDQKFFVAPRSTGWSERSWDRRDRLPGRALRRRVVEEICLRGPAPVPGSAGRTPGVPRGRSGRSAVPSGPQYRPIPTESTHRGLDILTVLFLLRFTKKPLRFFGMVGVSTFVLGSVLIAYLVVERLFFGQSSPSG